MYCWKRTQALVLFGPASLVPDTYSSLGQSCRACADCVLSDFDGFRVLRARSGSTASLVGCTLANINLVVDENAADGEKVAVIQACADPMWNGSLVLTPPLRSTTR